MDIFNVTVVDFVLFQKYSSRVIAAGDVIANTTRMEKHSRKHILTWLHLHSQADTEDLSQNIPRHCLQTCCTTRGVSILTSCVPCRENKGKRVRKAFLEKLALR